VAFAVSFLQLLLALVFAVAGFAKLIDSSGTRLAIEAFGVPRRLSAAGSMLLPVAELTIAVALVPAATARWGALAALAVLAIFSLAVVRVLRTGSTPDCNCFGGLTQTEVGRGTVIRNLIFGSMAALIALSGESVSAFRWITVPAARDRAGIVLLVAALAVLGWFCWRLLQQNGRLLLRLEAEGAGVGPQGPLARPPLEPGTTAPAFAGRDLDGEPVSLESLLALDRPVLLFFTDPGCGACELVVGDVVQAQRERADEVTVAVISSGSIGRIEAKAAEFGLDRVLPQDGDALLDAYRVHGFPSVVEIDPQGMISRTVALGPDAVREVVLGMAAAPPSERIGLAAR
jgi:peroxiredoxin